MNYGGLLKWGNKWATGRMIFFVLVGLGIILFANRYNLILTQNEFTDFGIKESVKFWSSGFFQLIRSILEHFSFNFILPIIFTTFSLGLDRLFNQYYNWKFPFFIGVLTAVSITLIWEFQHRPIEWIEIFYDLLAILLSYLFVKYMLKEFEDSIKKYNSRKNKK